MSEPVTTWRPLFDFDEADRQMHESETHEGAGDSCAGLHHAFDYRSEAGSVIEADVDLETHSPLTAVSPDPEPLFRGDFAEIEAALLEAARQAVTPAATAMQPLRALRADPDAEPLNPYAALSVDADIPQHAESLLSPIPGAAFFGAPDAPGGSFLLVDDAAISGTAALDEEDKRSRRPLYIMGALVLAGLVGMTTSSIFKHDGSGDAPQEAAQPAAIAPVATDYAAPQAPTPVVEQAAAAPAPVAPQAAVAKDVPLPAPVAATVSAEAAPAPVAAQIAALSPAEAPAALAITGDAPATASSILAPPPVAETPALGSIGEVKKVKTAAVRPDGALIKADQPAKQADAQSNVVAAKSVHAKDPSVKAAAKAAHANAPKVAKAAGGTKLAAAKPAIAAKSKPAGVQDAQFAQAAPADAQSAAPTPKPAATGPLAFVDGAVNSITGATGKLLDWGRSAHN